MNPSITHLGHLVESLGYQVKPKSNGFWYTNSGVCHDGGDSDGGVWVTLTKRGYPIMLCHKCHKQADTNIRRKLGLPTYEDVWDRAQRRVFWRRVSKPGKADKAETTNPMVVRFLERQAARDKAGEGWQGAPSPPAIATLE